MSTPFLCVNGQSPANAIGLLILHSDESVQKWTTKSERTNVAFIYEAGKGWNMGGGIETLANLNFASSNKRYVVVLGKEVEKQELIEYVSVRSLVPMEYWVNVIKARRILRRSRP
jgi:hypothetical protein